MWIGKSVQSPSAYDAAHLTAEKLGTRLAAGANAALRGNLRTALQDVGYRYKITPAETAAGMVEADLTFGYLPGDVLRYGADPTGVSPSDDAWQKACDANTVAFDGYEEGGLYTFAAGIVPTRYPLSIRGASLSYGSGTGTRLRLLASAGAAAVAIHFTGAAYGTRIRDLSITFEDATLGQTAIKFDLEWRGGRICDCSIETSDQTAANTTIGIWLAGGGVFSGQIRIDGCNLSNLQYGIFIAGSVTSLRVFNNDIHGNTLAPAGIGINIGNLTNGIRVYANNIEGWSTVGAVGVLTQGIGTTVTDNRFEQCVEPFRFTRGAGNAFSRGRARDNHYTTCGAPVYPLNGVDFCTVDDDGFADWDSAQINSVAGFMERGRAAGVGEYTAPAFAAGNFTGSVAMTWTVAAGDVSDYKYTLVGQQLTLDWNVITSDIGGTVAAALRIVIPGSYTSKGAKRVPCTVQNNGVWSMGMALVQNGVGYIEIYIDATGGNNWTLSAGNAGTSGSITFEVN